MSKRIVDDSSDAERAQDLAQDIAQNIGEARYRTLFEYAPDGLLIADTQSYYLDANPAICKMLGYSRQEMIGKHAADIVAPTEVQHVEPALEQIKAKADYSRRWTFRRKDGSTFPAEVIVTVMPEGTLLAMIRDVTERVEAERVLRDREAQLRIASRIARLGAWSFEMPSGKIHWSDELCALMGVAKGTVPSTDSAMNLYAPEFRETMRATGAQAVIDKGSFETEAQLLTVDGRRRWVRVIGQTELNAQGVPTRLYGTVQDIDDQHKLQAQLHQAQKMEAVGLLAGGVAHDFNNLLSVVLSYAELLQRQLSVDSPLYADVEEIRRAGERATTLTRQLLAFGRRQMMQPRVMDIAQIVTPMESMLRRLLGETIELSLRKSPALGHVLVDPAQVEQIVMNLAVNARDAMPQSGGKVQIELANTELDATYTALHHELSPGAYVMLAISDNGCGMDAATRERIFEPFFTTKEQGKGTGLGLSTVFGIVKQSRGHIAVYSEVGRGTTFKIYLPRTDQPIEPIVPRVDPLNAHGTETILLVEDEAQVRAVTAAVLSRYGYRVLVAGRGDEACAVSDRHLDTIDLLITDVVMPGMSGIEVAKKLRQRRPSIRVLYVSGYTETAIIEQGLLEPNAAFLPKPITTERLSRKVRDVLDARYTRPPEPTEP